MIDSLVRPKTRCVLEGKGWTRNLRPTKLVILNTWNKILQHLPTQTPIQNVQHTSSVFPSLRPSPSSLSLASPAVLLEELFPLLGGVQAVLDLHRPRSDAVERRRRRIWKSTDPSESDATDQKRWTDIPPMLDRNSTTKQLWECLLERHTTGWVAL